MNINEKTHIPLVWLASIASAIPFVVSGIFWLASVDSKASSAKEELAQAKSEILGIRELVIDVRERTIRIEAGLKANTK